MVGKLPPVSVGILSFSRDERVKRGKRKEEEMSSFFTAILKRRERERERVRLLKEKKSGKLEAEGRVT